MKWPEKVMLGRHGESDYNKSKLERAARQDYQDFLEARTRYRELRQHDLQERAVHGLRTETIEALACAQALAQALISDSTFVVGANDSKTGLTKLGDQQSEATGRGLKEREEGRLPDVILLSPYKRTRLTREGYIRGWPELADVKTVIEDRVREQEHGLRTIYGDWRVAEVLSPEQEMLRKATGPYWYRYPQGENVPDVRERARSVNNTLIRDYSGKVVLIITHHLYILSHRANQERWEEEDFIDANRNDRPDNGSITTYICDSDQGEDGKLILPPGGYNQTFL